MRGYSLAHLTDPELLRGLASLVAQDRVTTATLLAHIAEFDARRLYLPAAYPSTFAYCVHELRLSEEAAFKRIHAARTARRFPAIFAALAEGRFHLSAVVMLAPHLSPENADELLAAATHRTKAEIEELLAQRFPRPDRPERVEAIPAPALPGGPQAPGLVDQHAPGRVEPPARRPTVAPLSPDRFLIQFTVGRDTQEKLRYAQDLLGHALPSGDVARVFDRALDTLIEHLERQKFAATPRPRRSGRPSTHPRHVPAQVKRAVWERDGGQCTFVSEVGRRCPARKRLEFDHVEPVARGGRASVVGIRLRCHAHNQYEAECAFGAEFMRHKREEARRKAEARRQEADARAADAARARAAVEEVITPLRLLGFRADEARCAAALCEAIPDASLEERVRRALSYFQPRLRMTSQAAASPGSAP